MPVEGCDAVLLAAGFRGVELCTSRDVDRPSVIGFFSPRILIPEELFARLTTAEFGQIVLHEVGHLRRADDWINLFQKLSLVVFPLNPVLIWIERRLCLERELACDDDVLRLTKAPKAYATCLTNLAEQRLGRRATALSLGVWEKRSELARRVHSILRGGEGMGRTQARVLMGVLVVALLSGSAELARCPEVVSFSSQNESPAAGVVQSLRSTAGYQTASFRMPAAKNNQTVAAHETLLKASMPVDRGTDPVSQIVPKHHGLSAHTKQNHVRMRQARGLTVLTSWEEEAPSRRVFAEEHVIFTSYAAVRVAGGWLVIQL